MRTRLGMLIRAGASNREMVGALGVEHQAAVHAGVWSWRRARGPRWADAGADSDRSDRHGREHPHSRFRHHSSSAASARSAALSSPLSSSGSSIRWAAPIFTDLLRLAFTKEAAATAAPALSSMLIYLLMAIVLVVRPEGLFPASGK